MYETFPFIIETLKWARCNGGRRAIDAKGLFVQINNSSFIRLLIIMKCIFGTTRSLSNMLQYKCLDLAKACMLVDVTIQQLRELKSDRAYNQLLQLFVIILAPAQKHRLPTYLSDSVVMENVGHTDDD